MRYETQPAVKDVFLYLRKSTKDEQERQLRSIGDQKEDCLYLADRLNLNIIDEFIEDQSASKPNNRPMFKSMLKELSYRDPKRRRAEGVLAWHPDRLSRNALEAGQLIQMLDDEHIKDMYFPAYQFHNDTSGKEHLTIEFARAKGYTDRLSEVVCRGVTGREKEGAMIYPAKYGYTKRREVPENPQKCSLFPIPHTVSFPIVERMFVLAFEGHSVRQIREYLIDEFPDAREFILGVSAIDARLRDPFYCGQWIIKPSTKQERIIDLNNITLPDGTSFIPVCTHQQFECLQKLRSSKRTISMPRKPHRINPLPGLVFCQNCGRKMYPNFRKIKRGGNQIEEQLGYECQTIFEHGKRCPQSRIKSNQLFDKIEAQIRTHFPTMNKRDYEQYQYAVGKFIKSKQLESKQERSRVTISLEKIKSEKRKIIQQRAELISANAYDKHSKAHYETRLKELAQSEENLADSRTIQSGDLKTKTVSFKKFLELIEKLPQHWSDANHEQKAALSKILFWNLSVEGAETRSVSWNPLLIDPENQANFDSGRAVWNLLEPHLDRWWKGFEKLDLSDYQRLLDDQAPTLSQTIGFVASA